MPLELDVLRCLQGEFFPTYLAANLVTSGSRIPTRKNVLSESLRRWLRMQFLGLQFELGPPTEFLILGDAEAAWAFVLGSSLPLGAFISSKAPPEAGVCRPSRGRGR